MAVADAARAEVAAAEAMALASYASAAPFEDMGAPLRLNPGLLDIENARLTIAGPNSVYISGIKYAGEEVSARVRYSQGTLAAEALFQSTPNLVDLLDMSAVELGLVDDVLVISNIGIRGQAHTLILTFNDEGGVDVGAQEDGWTVRTMSELLRDKLIAEGTYLVNGFAGGEPLPNEGAWIESNGSVVQTDSSANHAKFTIPASHSGSDMLFGVTAKPVGDSDNVGFGLHFLASGAPDSGATKGYGRSYLFWVMRDLSYGNEETYLQLYESRENSTLLPLVSWRIQQSATLPLTVEALYQDSGVITLLVSGVEQFTMNMSYTITTGDRIALRASGGVEFMQVYVASKNGSHSSQR